jgi:virulence factor Mce-like protein
VIGARGKAAAAIVAVAVAGSGCATNGLASLPLPAPGLGSGGYRLTAVFGNALNLPMNAKVKLAGADVGQVESMIARNYTAVTALRIRDGVLLPKGSTAELRTATPLGDVFVSVRPPAEAARDVPMLRDGDTIGLQSTASAATVESVLSSAAILVNGGAVRNFTNIINGFGRATGDQGQAFGDLIRKSNQLLRTLDARSGQISNALTELSRLSEQLDAKNQSLSELMAAANPATDALASNTTDLSNLVIQIGDTSRLLARFPSLGGTDTSGRSIIRDLNAIAAAANDVVVSPDTSWLALNRLIPVLIKSTAGNAISVNVGVDQLILGSIPDIGFPGDRGLHGPSRYTWNELVGSLKYTLWRLQERVVGRGPNSVQVPVMPDPAVPGKVIIGPPAPGAPPTASEAPPAPGPYLPGLLTPGPPP